MSFNVIGVGEVLWDMLPTGRQLGGAPANFAYHAGALGARGGVISRVGRDRLGDEILVRLQTLGLITSEIQIDSIRPTGTVAVELSGDGQPSFAIHENVAWDYLALVESALAAAARADAVSFGTLAQRGETSRKTIQALAAAVPPRALRIFDINFRQSYYSREIIESSLQLANVVKLNDGELPILAATLGLRGNVRQQMEQLAASCSLRAVCLTRGASGSLLFCDGQWADDPGRPVEVKDTVGAGDAFTASLAMGLLAGKPLQSVNQSANELARYVCSREGATPPHPRAVGFNIQE